MKINCTIVTCTDGREKHSFWECTSMKEVQKMVTHLQGAVTRGQCDKFVVMFSGEFVQNWDNQRILP